MSNMETVKIMNREYNIKKVEELYGHANFRELEEEVDESYEYNLIYYADGCLASVTESMIEDWDVAKALVNKIVEFDGWYIALTELCGANEWIDELNECI